MNRQLRRNRAGDRHQPTVPVLPIKQGDLDDERRKLNMPTQFRITTDTSIFSSPVLGSGCFRHSAVMCTAPGFAPSTRQALDHTILRHCVAKRQKRNGTGGRIQGDSRKTHLWYGVENSSRKRQVLWVQTQRHGTVGLGEFGHLLSRTTPGSTYNRPQLQGRSYVEHPRCPCTRINLYFSTN